MKTVFKTVYPPETADFTPIVQKYANAKPDLVFAGTQSDDAYAQVKAMVQQKFSPKYLFLSNGANSPTEFPTKVGAGNTNGIFSCGDWFSDLKSSGNPQFVAAYLKKYGGKPDAIDPGSAEAYAVGQLVEEVAAKTKKVDNKTPHLLAAPGDVARRRRRPELEPGRLAEGQHADGRVGRRQARARLSAGDRPARADLSQAGLGRLGRRRARPPACREAA